MSSSTQPVRASLAPEVRGTFPPSFHYGYASAAYQIEGSTQTDGRGQCNWDVALQSSPNGSGDPACDSYRLWRDDVELLKQYGVNTYRFSISWPRIIPLGGRNDPVNEKGIEYYSNLIDALLEAGITPFVTIFHWDLPIELINRYGGFLCAEKTEIVQDFVRFADVCFERFGDRVKNWITINEPHIFTFLNKMALNMDTFDHEVDSYIHGHRLLLCHAHTVDLYRRKYQSRQNGRIAIVLDCDWLEPIDDSVEARDASERALQRVVGWFAEPIYKGRLCQVLKNELGDAFPDFTPDEWKLVKGSSDFFGLNTYGTSYVTGKPPAMLPPPGTKNISPPQIFTYYFGAEELTSTGEDGQPIGRQGEGGHPNCVPWGFGKLLRWLSKTYTAELGIPIIITENGFPVEGEEHMARAEAIEDTHRQEYYDGYVRAMCDAAKDGVKIEGYMGWSLLDNLEWARGYGMKFGVTVVDREDGCKRYPKKSALMLRDVFKHITAST